jgi:hypothetical protein
MALPQGSKTEKRCTLAARLPAGVGQCVEEILRRTQRFFGTCKSESEVAGAEETSKMAGLRVDLALVWLRPTLQAIQCRGN